MSTGTPVPALPVLDPDRTRPERPRSLAAAAKKSLASRAGSAGWWTFFRDPEVTLENHQEVLFGSSSNGQLAGFFVNSLMIVIPSVILPVTLATLAAYAFSWMKFCGRDWLFIVVFALQIVPRQMALIPLLRIFSSDAFDPVLEYVPYMSLWLAHTAFALPLAIFLLHNFISEVSPAAPTTSHRSPCGWRSWPAPGATSGSG